MSATIPIDKATTSLLRFYKSSGLSITRKAYDGVYEYSIILGKPSSYTICVYLENKKLLDEWLRLAATQIRRENYCMFCVQEYMNTYKVFFRTGRETCDITSSKITMISHNLTKLYPTAGYKIISGDMCTIPALTKNEMEKLQKITYELIEKTNKMEQETNTVLSEVEAVLNTADRIIEQAQAEQKTPIAKPDEACKTAAGVQATIISSLNNFKNLLNEAFALQEAMKIQVDAVFANIEKQSNEEIARLHEENNQLAVKITEYEQKFNTLKSIFN